MGKRISLHPWPFVSDIAVFVLKRDVKLQPANQPLVVQCTIGRICNRCMGFVAMTKRKMWVNACTCCVPGYISASAILNKWSKIISQKATLPLRMNGSVLVARWHKCLLHLITYASLVICFQTWTPTVIAQVLSSVPATLTSSPAYFH